MWLNKWTQKNLLIRKNLALPQLASDFQHNRAFLSAPSLHFANCWFGWSANIESFLLKGQLCYFITYILKGSLDLIPWPSPSEKFQTMGGKVCLMSKGKTLLGVVNKLLNWKVCWRCPAMFCLYISSKFHPAYILNFH